METMTTRNNHPSIAVCAFAGLLTLLISLCSISAMQAQAENRDSGAQTPVAASTVPVRNVDIIGMTVSDLDRSVEFYTNVLSFQKQSEVEVAGEQYEHLQGVFGLRMRVARLRLGNERIELTEYLTPRGRAVPADSVSNDRWFQHIAIITTNMDRAYQWLRDQKVRHASTGPQALPSWNKNAGGIKAFYFHDPDDHVLEILQFPTDKGNPKWRKLAAESSQETLFLGIDHTAIVVGDTDKSLAFYRDVLGMEVAGASENYGTEQEHLNNVFGARLRITSLRPRDSSGPSIEFLEYLAPRNGRPYPTDAKPNDLFHWQSTLIVDDVGKAIRALDSAHVVWISTGAVDTSDAQLGFHKAALLRDPDGHALRLIER